MIAKTFAASAFAAFLAIAPASAQDNVAKGLVTVQLTDIQVELLRNANIDVDILNDNQIAVPVAVAAIVCAQDVNVLASDNDRGAKSCDATDAGVEQFISQRK